MNRSEWSDFGTERANEMVCVCVNEIKQKSINENEWGSLNEGSKYKVRVRLSYINQ